MIYDGKYVMIYDVFDDNVGLFDYCLYLFLLESVFINVMNIKSDSIVYNFIVVFENGCWFRMSWYYMGSFVVFDGISEGCLVEVG